MNCAVIGAGAWGTALANVLAANVGPDSATTECEGNVSATTSDMISSDSRSMPLLATTRTASARTEAAPLSTTARSACDGAT